MRSLSVLSKILGLTASSNPHEAKAAEEKLEKQLQEKVDPIGYALELESRGLI